MLRHSGTSPPPSACHHREHGPEQAAEAVMVHLQGQIAKNAAPDMVSIGVIITDYVWGGVVIVREMGDQSRARLSCFPLHLQHMK